MIPVLEGLAWFLSGSFVGSFLNVCIYRLPREESIADPPRSRCPSCKHQIAWYDNIPLLSYAALRAKCRHCQATISWRYPVVEALTGAMTVAVVARFGVTPVSLVYAAFVWALIVASFVDLEFQIIPDEISVGGLVLGLIVSVLIPALHGADSIALSLRRSFVGALVGGGLLYTTGMLGDFIFRKESMGGGDIKLLAMAGAILGWRLVTLTFFISPMLALVPGLGVLFLKRSHVIPYGPFLSLGLLVSLFAGEPLLRWIGIEESIRFFWEYYH
jgi:leader peptidase (prepilin peptidase)/N-methyltransferase